MENIDVVIRRIERLERENRRFRRLTVLLALVMTWPLLLAAGKDGGASVLEASKLVLKDEKGVARAELGTQPDGSPVLTFADGKGGASLALRGTMAAPIIELADGTGGSVWISSSATGASLSLGKGKGEVELATNASGQPSVKLVDRDGKLLWHAP